MVLRNNQASRLAPISRHLREIHPKTFTRSLQQRQHFYTEGFKAINSLFDNKYIRNKLTYVCKKEQLNLSHHIAIDGILIGCQLT